MSPKVHQLPEDLIARIAAGEVVERPASVIKEMVENSLDAGARRISVAIEGAGRTLLGVSDDGCGMTKEDARLALRRHATSKIASFDDLEAIGTFGFRGEALPSIAAVSRFRLATRSAEEEMGWEFLLEGGKMISERPIAREPGTTIEVRDLFFNTPARFKFLKSDATERTQCLRVMEELVFASLGTTFELSSEKAKANVFQGHAIKEVDAALASLQTRIIEAWGIRWGQSLLSVHARNEHFGVWGAVTNQAGHQATPRNQFLYVNRRPVLNRRLVRAVYDAYVGQLPSLRHPAWVLFLEVDPRTVDVNVHPSKREVKLTHESELFGFLVNAVKRGLQSTPETPVDIFSTPNKPSVAAAPSRPMKQNFYETRPTPSQAGESLRELYRPLEISKSAAPLPQEAFSAATAAPEIPGLRGAELKAIEQVRNCFIIAQSPEGIVIVDQHAAAEKVIYERLMANLNSKAPDVQMLLVPFTWETSLSVYSWVLDKKETLAAMGYILEPFGGNTFLVKGHPAHLGDKFDLHSLLDGVSDLMAEPTDRKGGWNLTHRLAAMSACKAAVKDGDPLDIKECDHLLKEIVQCEAPFTCPHGRPTMIRLSYSELEHRFRRT